MCNHERSCGSWTVRLCNVSLRSDRALEFLYFRWNDDSCKERIKHCTACQFKNPPVMALRGLCEKTEFDKEFTMFEYRNDKAEFRGAFESSIYWDNTDFDLETGEGDAFWKIAAFTTNRSHAKMITNDPKKYPLGKNK